MLISAASLAVTDAADAATQADHGSGLMLTLFAMLAVAKLMAELFSRLGQPPVVGEILAGVLIGPQLLAWVHPGEITSVLAEMGVIFLMFSVGLETPPSSILRVGRRALMVGVLGIVLPFICGAALMHLFGGGTVQSLFVGTALVATSVGITAKVLSDLGLLDSQAARIILGAAVIDDILGLLVLAAVSNAASGEINWAGIVTTAGLALGFVAAVALIGAPMVTRAAPQLKRLRVGNADFAVAICLCLGLAFAAASIGVAAIIGAFLGGLAMADAAKGRVELQNQVKGVTEFLTPFFLVNIGMQLNLSVFAEPRTLALALSLTMVAVLTKLAACGLGAAGLGLRGALQVGVGMVPRGEVGIVVAQLGLAMAVIDQKVFGAVLFMAVATTVIAPPLLRPLFRKPEPHSMPTP
jgi:Kef-type K+ transport system membrane component KefB